MSVARMLTDADLDALRRMVRDEVDALEARLRRQRPRGQRRTKSVAAGAVLASEVRPPDELARAKADVIVARLKMKVAR